MCGNNYNVESLDGNTWSTSQTNVAVQYINRIVQVEDEPIQLVTLELDRLETSGNNAEGLIIIRILPVVCTKARIHYCD